MLLEKICEELGVEIGEKWAGSDGYYYKITNEGLIGFYYPTSDDEENFDIDNELWVNIIIGELKPNWKPKKGETYYTPRLNHHKKERFITRVWAETEADYFYFNNNMAFKTKEECNRKSQEIIDGLGVIK